MTTLRIRQHKSRIGEKAGAKGTLSALGLGKPGAEAAFEDSVTVRGMLRRVAHLVHVTEGDAEAKSDAKSDAKTRAKSGAKSEGTR